MFQRRSSRQSNAGAASRQRRRLDMPPAPRPAAGEARPGRALLADFLDGHQRTADDAAAQLAAVEPEDRRVGHGVELAERALLDLRRAFRVERKDRIEDDRMRRQLGAALQHLPEGELVEPAERQPIAEWLKLAAHLGAPEVFQPRSPDHHADAGRVGQQRQSGLDDARRVVRDDDRRGVRRQRIGVDASADRRLPGAAVSPGTDPRRGAWRTARPARRSRRPDRDAGRRRWSACTRRSGRLPGSGLERAGWSDTSKKLMGCGDCWLNSFWKISAMRLKRGELTLVGVEQQHVARRLVRCGRPMPGLMASTSSSTALSRGRFICNR